MSQPSPHTQTPREVPRTVSRKTQPTTPHSTPPHNYSAPYDPRYEYEDSLPSPKRDLAQEHKKLLTQELTMWGWN